MTKQNIYRGIGAIIGALCMVAGEVILDEAPLFSPWWTVFTTALLFGGMGIIFVAAILPFVECQVEEPEGGGYE